MRKDGVTINASPITRVYNDNKTFIVTFKDGSVKEIIGKSFREAFEKVLPWTYENMRLIEKWTIKKED